MNLSDQLLETVKGGRGFCEGCQESHSNIAYHRSVCPKEEARWQANVAKKAEIVREAEANNHVYGILDIFHPSINKGETPEVRSDDPCFNGDIEEFFRWCRIHNADNQWYVIDESVVKIKE